jgi:hypothetical protein
MGWFFFGLLLGLPHENFHDPQPFTNHSPTVCYAKWLHWSLHGIPPEGLPEFLMRAEETHPPNGIKTQPECYNYT